MLLETTDSTEDFLRLKVLELPNSDRLGFINYLQDFIKDEVYRIYYSAKYVIPRAHIKISRNTNESQLEFVHRYISQRPKKYSYLEDKELDLLCCKSESIKQQIENPYTVIDISEHFYPLEHPQIDSWILLKIEDFRRIPQILNNFSFVSSHNFLVEETSLNYQFPEYLVDNEFKHNFEISDRIQLDQSFDEILKIHRRPFHFIKQFLNPKDFTAFIYNTFNFKGNQTELQFLNIPLRNKVTISLLRNYLFDLYVDLGFEKPKIGLIQLINFNYARKDLSNKLKNNIDQSKVFRTHYLNISKNKVSLIPKELEKFEKRASIFPFNE
ncbi:hypothetical protein [Gillisia sp. JM1]|uniref:hypothetical protein n=1 Tax=Gillisia sp. JM1 TaxID=1283286 RepID=UPI0012DD7CCC|nr:hypothetical protein [Gillisia sp. JM1]